jgi:hypothetical protein
MKRSETKGHYLVQCASQNQADARKQREVPLLAQHFELSANVLCLLFTLGHGGN